MRVFLLLNYVAFSPPVHSRAPLKALQINLFFHLLQDPQESLRFFRSGRKRSTFEPLLMSHCRRGAFALKDQ